MRYTKSRYVAALTVVAFAAAFGLAVADASATPAISSAVFNLRVFNDDPGSTVTTGNTYANPPNGGSIFIMDENVDGVAGAGFANRHNWRFSENGIDGATFLNGDGFAISADVTLTGTAAIEGGLQVSPWWSQNVDGGLVLTPGGEIAAFGGRLPFYSFNSQSVTYTKGETVRLGITYSPNGLVSGSPGSIQYRVTKAGTTYFSPWLAFDQGNPAEDPPYGLWGILNDARVGGYTQIVINSADPTNWGRAQFDNISFVPEPASLALLALGGLTLLRRRT